MVISGLKLRVLTGVFDVLDGVWEMERLPQYAHITPFQNTITTPIFCGQCSQVGKMNIGNAPFQVGFVGVLNIKKIYA